jgi:hypothetical protein
MGIKDAGKAPTLGSLEQVLGYIGKYGGGSTGGDAGAKAKEEKVKRFMKAYKSLLIGMYGTRGGFSNWQLKVMAKCASQELPPSTFATLIRRYDPRYVRTDEYKDRASAAALEWKRWFPDKKVPNRFANSFARSTMSRQRMAKRIEESRQVKKNYKWLTVARDAGSAAGNDPGTYRTYRDALNASYRTYLGREATPLEQRMMFHSAMTDREFQAALTDVFGGVGSFRWAKGYVPPTRTLQKAAFGAKASDPLYNAILGARQQQQTYMASQARPFDFNLDEDTGSIVMSRI